jgi:DNA invertase Pin-like site-specific DNA recombinase
VSTSRPKTGKNPKTAAIYARQSKELSDGIERQVKVCKKLCESNGWTVVKVYEDNDVSAYKNRGKGTAWAQMLTDIVDLEIDVVVATNMDRLLRRVPDLAPLVSTGASVLTVDGELNLDSAEGEFRATMGAGLAQFETKRKAERQVRANDARVAKGLPAPSRRRYGYETDGCTPRDSEAKVVKRIFEQFLAGASIRSISIDLQKNGIDPGSGNGWPARRVRSIIGNVFYGGQVMHRGEVSDSELIVPIVPRDTALKARAILADPSRRSATGAPVKHLLTGVAECGVCGGTLHFVTDYKCGRALNHVQIRDFKIEPEVIWEVHAWASSSGKPSILRKESKEIQDLMLESSGLLEKILELQDMATWPGADKTSIKSKIAKIGNSREAVEEKISRLRSRNSSHEILSKVQKAWNSPVDPKGFSDWKKAMIDSAELLGHPLKPEKITKEVFDQKVRIERQISDWPAFWNSIPLDQQREVIRGIMKITVSKGQGNERVKITRLWGNVG